MGILILNCNNCNAATPRNKMEKTQKNAEKFVNRNGNVVPLQRRSRMTNWGT